MHVCRTGWQELGNQQKQELWPQLPPDLQGSSINFRSRLEIKLSKTIGLSRLMSPLNPFVTAQMPFKVA